MSIRRGKYQHLQDSSGYSLLETMVALALFLTVLIPLIQMVVILSTQRPAQLKMEALAIAQSQIERDTGSFNCAPVERMLIEEIWWVEIVCIRSKKGRLITVRVGKQNRQRPWATLTALKPALKPE